MHSRTIPGLDAIRAAAVTMVVLYHQGLPFSGALGVTLFFVLSGFLITTMLLKEFARMRTLSLRNFYRRRSYRIFPTFYVCWVITMLTMVARHQHIVWKQAFESFFYMADYGRAFLPVAQQVTFPVGISWSLAIEEKYYLIWPVVLLALLARSVSIGRNVSIVVVGLWIWRAVLVFGFHVPLSYIYNAFDCRADALMIGGLLSILIYRRSVPNWLLCLIAKRSLILFSLAAMAVVTIFDLQHAEGTAMYLAVLSLTPVFAALLIAQLMFAGCSPGRGGLSGASCDTVHRPDLVCDLSVPPDCAVLHRADSGAPCPANSDHPSDSCHGDGFLLSDRTAVYAHAR
jgi:peptidoglycan/LPS O-acetylase OafA/YrhL